jgi:hypothetical protein
MAGVNEVGGRIVLILVFGMLASFVVGATVFAQAGSTGGTIGKTEKSVSGGAEAEQPKSKPQRSRKKEAALPTGAGGKQKLFINPTINGVRVDRCWHFGTECDERAATEWCRSKGLARATEWKWEYLRDTVGQSDGRRCPGIGCGGFSKISCE